MTTTTEQFKALFGKPAAFDVFFIGRPKSVASAIDAYFDHPPSIFDAVATALWRLRREAKSRPAKSTLCLLCDHNFLKRTPAMVIIAAPSTREGPAVAFALCDDCVSRPDVEGRVRAYLADKLGLRETRWGTA